ncbi:MAG: hypothetical protein R3D61_02410 [Defluviimonas denitrificans]
MNRLIQPQLSAADTAHAVAGRHLTAGPDRRRLTRMEEELFSASDAFTIILRDEAMAAAQALDAALDGGAEPGLLCGVPVALKDFTPRRAIPRPEVMDRSDAPAPMTR